MRIDAYIHSYLAFSSLRAQSKASTGTCRMRFPKCFASLSDSKICVDWHIGIDGLPVIFHFRLSNRRLLMKRICFFLVVLGWLLPHREVRAQNQKEGPAPPTESTKPLPPTEELEAKFKAMLTKAT